jgi:hypothetical protein
MRELDIPDHSIAALGLNTLKPAGGALTSLPANTGLCGHADGAGCGTGLIRKGT